MGQKVILFEKEISYVKNGKEMSFPKLTGLVERVVDGEAKTKWFDVNFKKETKEKLLKEMIKKDLTYPVEVFLEDDDKSYFITVEEDKKGYEHTKLVILNYTSVEKAVTKPRERINIDDLFN